MIGLLETKSVVAKSILNSHQELIDHLFEWYIVCKDNPIPTLNTIAAVRTWNIDNYMAQFTE